MKKLIASSKYLIPIAIIVFFFIFYLIFTATTSGSFFQNFIAALLGTILTVGITGLLLKYQSQAEEVKQTNVEVFSKRVENYETITKVLAKVLADKVISKEEGIELNVAIHNMALFCSPESLEITIKFIRQNTLGDTQTSYTLLDVVSSFRKDLKLDNIEAQVFDLKSVNDLLSNNFEQLHQYQEIKGFMYELGDVDIEKLSLPDVNFEITEVEGEMDGIGFQLSVEGSEMVFDVEICYPEAMLTGEDDLILEVTSYGKWDKQFIKSVEKLGFSFEGDDLLKKEYPLKIEIDKSSKLFIKSKTTTLMKKILSDILKLEGALPH